MKHIKQLDGLRFIAIALVMIEHFAIAISEHFSAGYFGVDLFFVLSGFLITGILLKQQEHFLQSYKKFIGRRTLRIFPVYYIVILILYLLGNKYVHQYLIYCLTYTYNYAWAVFNIPINEISPLWSLCVEEQFYLFWPILILAFRKRLNMLIYLISVFILFCTLQLWFSIVPSVTPYNTVGLIPQAGALATGAIGAILVKNNKVPEALIKNKWIELSAFVLLIFVLLIKSDIKYIICPWLSLLFILKALKQQFAIKGINKLLENKMMVYTGTISYGIYLFHMPLAYYIFEDAFNWVWLKINFEKLGIFEKIRWNAWIFKLPLFSIGAMLVAHLSYQYIEKPLLTFKDKWFGYK